MAPRSNITEFYGDIWKAPYKISWQSSFLFFFYIIILEYQKEDTDTIIYPEKFKKWYDNRKQNVRKLQVERYTFRL